MAISNEYLLARIIALEDRINQLQDILENIPKLRQLGAIKASFEQDVKDINLVLADHAVRIEKLEK
jgi:hypothetical protein